MCVCFILMSIKQRVQHCTDGREGGKQEAKLPLMFRCCSFSYLEVHQCWEGNIQLRNSDPLQAAGMNTEKEDSKTLFLAKSTKSLTKVQIYNLTQ